MLHLYRCPNCASFNTEDVFGADYAVCKECGRFDFVDKFEHVEKPEIPYYFHQTIDIKHLRTKEYKNDF